MRNLTFLLLLTLACNTPKNEKSVSSEKITYTVDTLMIDSGEELLFLQSALSHSTISNDQKTLFNLSPKSEIEVIDLDQEILKTKIKTEKEGDLGTGQPYSIQLDQTDNFVLYGFNEIRFFGPNLNSMERFSLSEDALPGLESTMLAPFNPKVTIGKTLYSIYETYEREPLGLAKINLENGNVEKIPMEFSEKIVPFTFSLYVQGRLGNIIYEPIQLVLANDQLIISTAYSNEANIFDLNTKTRTLKKFHSGLTEDQAKIPPKTSAESINEIQDLLDEANKNVKFGPFIYDKTHQRFCRFSRELDREVGDSLIFKNVLTLFDKNLNQLGETEITIDPFSIKFFKEGKLWSYVNVDDELGFAVFTFDF